MFSDHQTSDQTKTRQTDSPKLLSHMGLDLSHTQTFQLKPDPIYQNYKPNQIHYVISALQKGLKPPSTSGLRRIKRKNFLKKQLLQSKASLAPPQDSLQPLNPKSPEQICLKSLRKQFQEQIAPYKQQSEEKEPSFFKVKQLETDQMKRQRLAKRKTKFIRKKQNQLRRRIELIALVKGHEKFLLKKFGRERMNGFSNKTKCPKISREEVKAALTEFYKKKIEQSQEMIRKINDPEEMRKMVDKKIEQRKDSQKKWKQVLEKRQRRAQKIIAGDYEHKSQSQESSSSSSESSAELDDASFPSSEVERAP